MQHAHQQILQVLVQVVVLEEHHRLASDGADQLEIDAVEVPADLVDANQHAFAVLRRHQGHGDQRTDVVDPGADAAGVLAEPVLQDRPRASDQARSKVLVAELVELFLT